ncbi:hypothetical protein TNCT_123841 [Trichonephila clavata]|uniref:Uncharacterized protein n=1 Tax=Trichonephila clavata TaxID=2740835 RepID=A0A8X6KFB6_TRICU|nr:hypothetical protein TNCT_123841 [Trichonephila clavata]
MHAENNLSMFKSVFRVVYQSPSRPPLVYALYFRTEMTKLLYHQSFAKTSQTHQIFMNKEKEYTGQQSVSDKSVVEVSEHFVPVYLSK